MPGSYARLLVVGSVAMDFVFSVGSYPNEGDQLEGKVRIAPGGKGLFQAVAAQRLRAETTLITSAGADYFADVISNVLVNERINLCVEKQPISPAHDSPIATDVVGSIAVRDKKTTYIACRDRSRLTSTFVEVESEKALQGCNAVLLSLDVSTQVVRFLIELAAKHDKSIPIIVNASPATNTSITLINGVTCMIATKDEALEWLEKAGHIADKTRLNSMTTEQIGDAFLKAGAKKVILTLEDEGCVVIDSKQVREYDAFRAGTGVRSGGTGARSAFCAAYAVALAEHQLTNRGDISEHEVVNFASAARDFARRNGVLGWDAMPRRAAIDEFIENGAEVKMRATKLRTK